MRQQEPVKKKNETFELDITDISDEGAGIGKSEGFTWFVKDAVEGDRVLAAATKVKKQYGFARLVKLLRPSADRVTPACPIARQCGGCQLQAMSYEAQLRFKQRKVVGNLRRIGGLELEEGKVSEGAALAGTAVEGAVRALPGGSGATAGIRLHPILGAPAALRYRNKAQVPFGTDREGRLVAGFYAGRTHNIIPCTDCLLGAAENQPILRCILDWMHRFELQAYNERIGKGLLRHVLLRKGYHTGEMMVCLIVNARKLPHAAELVEALLTLTLQAADGATGVAEDQTVQGTAASAGQAALHWPVPARITSISYCINRENTNVIMGTELVNLYGPGYIEDEIWEEETTLQSADRLRFRLSPLAFYQVNPVQMERLYQTALRFAGLSGTETVWDLYCGIGTISLFLARHAKQVYGLELIPQAVENARDNAARNGLSNTEFFVGKAEEVLPSWYSAHQDTQIDVIVTDPPRKGCDIACLETMVRMQPKRIVYVSCDSATLARDLKYLCANGYEVRDVQVVDQFSNTVHTECCVKLERRR